MGYELLFIWIGCLSVIANIVWFVSYIITRNDIVIDGKQVEYNIQLLELENAKLRSENDYNNHLIRVIAHDFRSPLQNLNTLLEYSSTMNFSIEEKEALLMQLKSATHYADYMLENLLIWADSQKLQNQITTEAVSIKELLAKIVEGLAPLAKEKNINLLNCVEEEALVQADFQTLWIVVNNLIVNAIKYSNEGQNIIITATDNTDKIQLDIIDFGIGIPEEMKDKLFVPDLEKNRPGTKYEKGTGIGLILCKRLIESQHGSIRVQSEPGKGSVFSIELQTIHLPVLNK